MTALNPAQARAVEHGEGPLLVLAGPGSGKTRVVTTRIARLLERGVPASGVLAVTFTNKAAREMRDRVRALAGEAARGLAISTFHAACVRILRDEIPLLGWSRNFSIYDEAAQQSMARAILRDMPGAGSTASRMLAGISAAKSGLSPGHAPGPAAGAAHDSDGLLAAAEARAVLEEEAGRRYQEELRARNAVDFDDIIVLVGRLFREHPEALARWQARFRHVLVDEYQDTNAAQDDILQSLCATHRNLCVVGDDDQSIYGWRGADVEHILRFTERQPGAAVVRLEQNYRSTGRIVAVANAVIERNPRRHGKTVFTTHAPGDPVRVVDLENEDEEAEWIASEIAREAGSLSPSRKEAARFAVLFRTNEQMRPLEQALRQASVPYRLLGGRSFFDRKEVLDTVAYLRLAANDADDEALFRIVNVPSRGIGASALQAVGDGARAADMHPWPFARDVAAGREQCAGAVHALGGLTSLADAVASVAAAAAARSRTLVTDLHERIGYQAEIERTYKDANVRAARWALAQEVQRAWEAHLADGSRSTLAEFLDGITLRERDDDADDGAGGVTLATMHASKGLEFPVVFVAGCEDGIVPHARSVDDGRSLEEERRLFYVAITRARQRLVLTRARTRTARGRKAEAPPSRFLEGLPEDAVQVGLSDVPVTGEAAAGNVARLREMLRGS